MHLKTNKIYKSYEKYLGKYFYFMVIGIEEDSDNDTIVKIRLLEDGQQVEEHVWGFSDFLKYATEERIKDD
jgi:hypothetical protein